MRKLLIGSIVAILFLVILDTPLSAQGKLDQAPGKNKNEAGNSSKNNLVVIGSVESVTGSTVVVEEKKGKKKTEAEVGQDTRIIGQDKKVLKIGALKLRDLIAVVSSGSGDATDSGKFKVKKIFVKEATAAAQLKRRAVHGVITNISSNIISLVHQIQRERTYTVVVNDLTVIKLKSEEATGSASLASLAVGQRIVAVGEPSDSGLVAKLIHVIPGKAIGIFKKYPLATPSASLAATPTASTTASAQPTVVPTPSSPASPSPAL